MGAMRCSSEEVSVDTQSELAKVNTVTGVPDKEKEIFMAFFFFLSVWFS